MNIYDRILGIICELFPHIEINDLKKNNLLNCGIDSFGYVNLILNLEKEFEISFDELMYDKNALKKIDDFAIYIEELLKVKK